MRLWHQFLIPFLPMQWLLGQHRELAALRGMGWKRPHREINYTFHYSIERLIAYHFLVLKELGERDIHYDCLWEDPAYRGKRMKRSKRIKISKILRLLRWSQTKNIPIYPTHSSSFLLRDLYDLLHRIEDYNQRMLTKYPHFRPVWFYRSPI